VTPDNGGYMVAAYIVVAVVTVVYAVSLAWRVRKLK
jgi:hypothetical protein